MNEATQDYIRPGYEGQPIPGFPHAPLDWSRESAEQVARSEGLTLTDEHVVAKNPGLRTEAAQDLRGDLVFASNGLSAVDREL